MSNKLPPPEMPPEQAPATMPQMLQKIRDETDLLEKSMAGYTSLSRILQQVTEGVASGDRALGLPILQYRATADGVHTVEVRADLAKINPQFVPHVLSPLANAHAVEMYESLVLINKFAKLMLNEVLAAMSVVLPAGHQAEEEVEEAIEPPESPAAPASPTPPVS